IVGVTNSRIAAETRRCIADILAWDLAVLERGVFPASDQNKNPWPRGSARALKIGQNIGVRACFAYWAGDMEAHAKSHSLLRHYNKWSICDWCWAAKGEMAAFLGFTGKPDRLLHRYGALVEVQGNHGMEICEATWLFDTFLLAYAHAASRFHGMGICLYKLRPKMHYTQHMVSELSFNKLNFYHAANFLDEDHMKFLKIVSAGCHVTSQP
ncbi:unnamed protein product, partial [Symbiodinium microadriaticum]